MALDSIGLVEVAAISLGIQAQDAMVKAASVELLLARTICSGKYLIVVAGDVASVQAAVDAGAKVCGGSLIEKRTIAHVHESVFPAISMAVDLAPERARALGVIETFSAASVVEVADVAVKSADVALFRIHLAMAVGGKGFVLVTGDVAAGEGMLVGRVVIAAPSREAFRDFV